MKRFNSHCLWVVLAMQLAWSLPAQSVTMMTYNIRLDLASDGENDWSHRRDFMVAQIKFYAPDIFGTQEGLPHQIDFLQKNLEPYGHEGIGREGVGKGESTAIFTTGPNFRSSKATHFGSRPRRTRSRWAGMPPVCGSARRFYSKIAGQNGHSGFSIPTSTTSVKWRGQRALI